MIDDPTGQTPPTQQAGELLGASRLPASKQEFLHPSQVELPDDTGLIYPSLVKLKFRGDPKEAMNKAVPKHNSVDQLRQELLKTTRMLKAQMDMGTAYESQMVCQSQYMSSVQAESRKHKADNVKLRDDNTRLREELTQLRDGLQQENRTLRLQNRQLQEGPLLAEIRELKEATRALKREPRGRSRRGRDIRFRELLQSTDLREMAGIADGDSITVSMLKEENERLHEQVYLDDLTGLTTKKPFEDQVNKAIERRQKNPEHYKNHSAFLVFLDLNNLRLYNNIFGHDVGDAVIRHVAKTIEKNIKPGDSVARMGNHADEFGVLLLSDNEQSAQEFVKNVQAAVSKSPYERSYTLKELKEGLQQAIGNAELEGEEKAAVVKAAHLIQDTLPHGDLNTRYDCAFATNIAVGVEKITAEDTFSSVYNRGSSKMKTDKAVMKAEKKKRIDTGEEKPQPLLKVLRARESVVDGTIKSNRWAGRVELKPPVDLKTLERMHGGLHIDPAALGLNLDTDLPSGPSGSGGPSR